MRLLKWNEAVTKFVNEDGKYFFVLVSAPWCGPCRKLKRDIEVLNPEVDVVILDHDSLLSTDPTLYNYLFDGMDKTVPLLLKMTSNGPGFNKLRFKLGAELLKDFMK